MSNSEVPYSKMERENRAVDIKERRSNFQSTPSFDTERKKATLQSSPSSFDSIGYTRVICNTDTSVASNISLNRAESYASDSGHNTAQEEGSQGSLSHTQGQRVLPGLSLSPADQLLDEPIGSHEHPVESHDHPSGSHDQATKKKVKKESSLQLCTPANSEERPGSFDTSGYVLDLPPIPHSQQPDSLVKPVAGSVPTRNQLSSLRRQSIIAEELNDENSIDTNNNTLTDSDWMSIHMQSMQPVGHYTPLQSPRSRGKLSVTYDTPSHYLRRKTSRKSGRDAKKGRVVTCSLGTVFLLGIAIATGIGIAGWMYNRWLILKLTTSFERCSESRIASIQSDQLFECSGDGCQDYNITTSDLLNVTDTFLDPNAIREVLLYVVVQCSSGSVECSEQFCSVSITMVDGERLYTQYIVVPSCDGHVTSDNVRFPIATSGMLQVSSQVNVNVAVRVIGYC